MELERLKSDFIARVSHELRTPITIIKGFLDTMLAHEDTLGAEQRHHMLERSHLAASRLSRLIEELLILSRSMPACSPRSRPRSLVQTILDDVRESATEPEQVLVRAPAGATLTTDPMLLARALGLVVDNAIKYGGTAEVTAELAGTAWTFEVRDRGPASPRTCATRPSRCSPAPRAPRRSRASASGCRSLARSWRCSTATSPSTTPTPAPVRSCASPSPASA